MVGQILHVENAQQLQRTFLCDALPPPVFRQAQDRRRGAVLHLIVQSNQDVVQHTQLAEQADILEGAGNAHVIHLNGGLPCRIHAVEQDGAARRLIDLREQVEDRGFAGAVRADQAGDLCAADGEVEVADGGQAAKINAEMARFQDRRHSNVALRNDIGRRDFDELCFRSFRFVHFPSLPFRALSFGRNTAFSALSSILDMEKS